MKECDMGILKVDERELMHYGPYTDRFLAIIRQVGDYTEVPSRGDLPVQAFAMLRRALACFPDSAGFGNLPIRAVESEEGNEERLVERLELICLSESWRRPRCDLYRKLNNMPPEVSAYVKPPIWYFSGHPKGFLVFGGIFDVDYLTRYSPGCLNNELASHLSGLLVEHVVGAILFCLANDCPNEENPYFWIVKSFDGRILPVGVLEDTFWVLDLAALCT